MVEIITQKEDLRKKTLSLIEEINSEMSPKLREVIDRKANIKISGAGNIVASLVANKNIELGFYQIMLASKPILSWYILLEKNKNSFFSGFSKNNSNFDIMDYNILLKFDLLDAKLIDKIKPILDEYEAKFKEVFKTKVTFRIVLAS